MLRLCKSPCNIYLNFRPPTLTSKKLRSQLWLRRRLIATRLRHLAEPRCQFLTPGIFGSCSFFPFTNQILPPTPIDSEQSIWSWLPTVWDGWSDPRYIANPELSSDVVWLEKMIVTSINTFNPLNKDYIFFDCKSFAVLMFVIRNFHFLFQFWCQGHFCPKNSLSTEKKNLQIAQLCQYLLRFLVIFSLENSKSYEIGPFVRNVFQHSQNGYVQGFHDDFLFYAVGYCSSMLWFVQFTIKKLVWKHFRRFNCGEKVFFFKIVPLFVILGDFKFVLFQLPIPIRLLPSNPLRPLRVLHTKYPISDHFVIHFLFTVFFSTSNSWAGIRFPTHKAVTG